MRREELWFRYYNIVKEYKEKHGHTLIPANYEVDGMKVGSWLSRQRLIHSNPKNDPAINYKIKKLDELDIDWSVHENTWNKNYELLKEYYLKHGNSNIPKDYKIDGVNLWTWFNAQKQAYSKLSLSKDKIVMLNKLDTDWSIHDTKVLNKQIDSMIIYNIALFKKVNFVLRDLKLDGMNNINSKEEQKEIEKIMIKRIWG